MSQCQTQEKETEFTVQLQSGSLGIKRQLRHGLYSQGAYHKYWQTGFPTLF